MVPRSWNWRRPETADMMASARRSLSTGLLRNPSMPAPRHSSLSLSDAFAVMATIGTACPKFLISCSHIWDADQAQQGLGSMPSNRGLAFQHFCHCCAGSLCPSCRQALSPASKAGSVHKLCAIAHQAQPISNLRVKIIAVYLCVHAETVCEHAGMHNSANTLIPENPKGSLPTDGTSDTRMNCSTCFAPVCTEGGALVLTQQADVGAVWS